MKIIDLLNKIANNEEVPKKIKIRGIIYKFTEIFTKNLTFADRGSNINNAYENDFENYWLDCARINEEVEILDEPKKIEKITVREKTLGFPQGEWTARNMDKAFAIKINELIDEVNKLKGDSNE